MAGGSRTVPPSPADWSFCPVLEDMIRQRRVVGESGRVFDGLGALSTTNNLAVLRALMLERRPQRTLEVGLSYGGSALAIAASHRDLGHTPARQHVALDPFQATDWDNTGRLALARAGLGEYVDVRLQRSAIGLARLAEDDRRFDLIYIDGSHLFDDVFVDAYFAFRLLGDGGVVLFDDCTIDHIAKVLGFVRANWGEWTREIDLGSYRGDGASLRYQLARRLGRVQLRAFERTGHDRREWDAPLRSF